MENGAVGRQHVLDEVRRAFANERIGSYLPR
jgi:hypothetical protein